MFGRKQSAKYRNAVNDLKRAVEPPPKPLEPLPFRIPKRNPPQHWRPAEVVINNPGKKETTAPSALVQNPTMPRANPKPPAQAVNAQPLDPVKAPVAQQALDAKTARNEARREGRNYAEEVMSRNVEGLTPQQRQAMQYEASQRIDRDLQRAQRNLLGEQGRRGIGGRSGVAFAQRRDLARAAQEQEGQAQRDLNRLNSELALKKLAAMFNIEQGEAAQSQLDRQLAIDELTLNEEKKRQRALEDRMNQLFSRL